MTAQHLDQRRQRRWRTPCGLFLVVGILYASTVSMHPSMDVAAADFAAWRIAATGDPAVDISLFPSLDHHPLRSTWVVERAGGGETIGRAPGAIAAGIPAYLVSPAGFSPLPGALMAALLVAIAVLLLYLALRPLLGDERATLVSGLVALTTPLWTVAADGMWPHTLTVLGILGSAWAARRESWWLVGIFGGLMLWGRLHAAVICAVVGLVVAARRHRPAIAVHVAIPSLVSLALLTAWTRWMYGSWDPTSAYRVGDFTRNAEGYLLDVPNHLGTWISPDRGILVWTPLVLLMLPALARAWSSLPDWSRALAFGGLAYTLMQTTLNRFSGGDAFYGYRIGLEMLVCLVPALALSVPRMGRFARIAWLPVAVLQWTATLTGAVVGESLGLAAEEGWRKNAFVWAMIDHPELLWKAVLPAIAIAVLAYRIWPDLRLTKDPDVSPQ